MEPLEIEFPLGGLDVAAEFNVQPALTSAVGFNVRTHEPLTQRGRGGNRPGLAKYVAGRVPAGAHLIQHLNVVVDPTIQALVTTFNDFYDPGTGLGGMDDPSSNNVPLRPRQPTPGRRVRVGGSGAQPNRHVGKNQQPYTPPSPPPPPVVCQKIRYEYEILLLYRASFNLQVSFTELCPCDPASTYGVTVDSDIGHADYIVDNDQAGDQAYMNSLVVAATGLEDAIINITQTEIGECGP